MISILFLCLLSQVPDTVRNEPLPEKRYQLALDTAAKALESGDMNLAAESTEFALESLEAMGKKPWQNGRNYKRMELRTRGFLRRADSIVKEAAVDDRPKLESLYNRINEVHEKVLTGVMSKKP